MTNHAALVNLYNAEGHTHKNIKVVRLYNHFTKRLTDTYYCFAESDWNGEAYNASECEEDGTVIDTTEHLLWPVHNWSADDDMEIIGFSTSAPSYPQASLDLLEE